MSYFDLNTEILFDFQLDSIWLHVWNGPIKWVSRYEISHVVQNFTNMSYGATVKASAANSNLIKLKT